MGSKILVSGSTYKSHKDNQASHFAEILFVGSCYVVYKYYVDLEHYNARKFRESSDNIQMFKRVYPILLNDSEGSYG